MRCDQTIQIHCCIHFPEIGLIIIEGVEFKDFDDQIFYVFDIKFKSDRLICGEKFLVGMRKINIHPFFEPLIGVRISHGVPLLHVADAVDDLCFHKNRFEPGIPDEFLVSLVISGIDEKVGEVVSHQFFIRANGRHPGAV